MMADTAAVAEATDVKQKELSQGIAFGSTQGDSSFLFFKNVAYIRMENVMDRSIRQKKGNIFSLDIWYNIIIEK